MQSTSTGQWIRVCALSDIAPDTGVCALLGGEQVAVFRVGERALFALSNYDPFSDAYVMSRGIIGDRGGVLKVASPIYKQNFELATGKCLDDAEVSLRSYGVREVDGQVEVEIP